MLPRLICLFGTRTVLPAWVAVISLVFAYGANSQHPAAGALKNTLTGTIEKGDDAKGWRIVNVFNLEETATFCLRHCWRAARLDERKVKQGAKIGSATPA